MEEFTEYCTSEKSITEELSFGSDILVYKVKEKCLL